MVRRRSKPKPSHRLPLSSSGDFRLALIRQGGGPAAGEGNRFELASQLDYQGTFESGRQSISGFGQDEGLDFGRIFALPETGAVEENTDVTVAHEQEAAVEQWEEELKQMLAGFEESSSAFDTPPTTDFYDWGQVVGGIELTG